ncbi:response regulator transcription factor [Pseudohaliea sp.]|uniref:helix-turn-helix transcriptional regulator n=1 Tax=Pseudohaliea sp. TaxID=2740289 RepID=UPI0032ED2C3D
MDQLFLSDGNTLAARWQEAFPHARLIEPGAAAGIAGAADALLWLDGGRIRDRGGLERAARQALEASPRVIVMRPAPSESEAFALLSLGVSGYCHLAASPAQLREIAGVVADGGIWMPPELLRRLLGLSRRVVSPAPRDAAGVESLTEKEFAVASLVGGGASNREIAERLAMSERTVKSHLSSIFRKMDVRDRVQLALAMNDIPVDGGA